MKSLSSTQIKQYQDKGFVAPIEALTQDEANEVKNEIEFIEKKWPKELKGLGRNNVHYISPIFDKVVHNSKILDAVEDVIGTNILVGGTTLFIKDPDQKSFVSFHQDAKYIGFEPHNWVTAWLAITDSNEEKFNNDQGNLLTRGQTIENVPIEKTEPVILKAGQMSLHHPRIAHGSGINKGNKRRIGFVIQSYIGTNVEQVIGKVYVQQARGEDLFNYHEHTKRPVNTMEKENIDIRNKANEALSKIFYSGLRQKGKF